MQVSLENLTLNLVGECERVLYIFVLSSLCICNYCGFVFSSCFLMLLFIKLFVTGVLRKYPNIIPISQPFHKQIRPLELALAHFVLDLWFNSS